MALLAPLFAFLLVVAPIFKLRTIIKRWEDAHIPIVVDAVLALRDAPDRDAALATLEAIDARLARLTVPYKEWEVLYRQRLQVERDLLRAGIVEPRDEPTVVDRVIEKVTGLIG